MLHNKIKGDHEFSNIESTLARRPLLSPTTLRDGVKIQLFSEHGDVHIKLKEITHAAASMS